MLEELKIPDQYIEMQLGHQVRDPNGGAYNRVKFLDDRKAMMQTWADYLDRLKEETLDRNTIVLSSLGLRIQRFATVLRAVK
jgi:hypothetical protein